MKLLNAVRWFAITLVFVIGMEARAVDEVIRLDQADLSEISAFMEAAAATQEGDRKKVGLDDLRDAGHALQEESGAQQRSVAPRGGHRHRDGQTDRVRGGHDRRPDAPGLQD